MFVTLSRAHLADMFFTSPISSCAFLLMGLHSYWSCSPALIRRLLHCRGYSSSLLPDVVENRFATMTAFAEQLQVAKLVLHPVKTGAPGCVEPVVRVSLWFNAIEL